MKTKEYSFEIYSLFRLKRSKPEGQVGDALHAALRAAVEKMGAVPDEHGFLIIFESKTASPPTPLCLQRNFRRPRRQPRSGGIR